jgi:hypothetical protein
MESADMPERFTTVQLADESSCCGKKEKTIVPNDVSIRPNERRIANSGEK